MIIQPQCFVHEFNRTYSRVLIHPYVSANWSLSVHIVSNVCVITLPILFIPVSDVLCSLYLS